MSRPISDFQKLPIDKMHRRKVIQSIRTQENNVYFSILKKIIFTDIMTTQESLGGGEPVGETGVLSGENNILQN